MMETGPERGFQRADSAAFFDSLDRLCEMTDGKEAINDAPVIVDGDGNVLGRPGVVLVYDPKRRE